MRLKQNGISDPTVRKRRFRSTATERESLVGDAVDIRRKTTVTGRKILKSKIKTKKVAIKGGMIFVIKKRLFGPRKKKKIVILNKRAYFLVKLWEKSFDIPAGLFNFFATLMAKASYRVAVFILVAAIAYVAIPGALSAPHSVTVTTKAEWDLGTNDNVSTESATDALQLQSDGTWTARVWAPTIDTIGAGSSSMIVGKYLYVMRGNSDKAFWRYDISDNDWEELSDLPFPSYYGGDMVSDGQGNLYIIFGGYSKKFYKYDTNDGSWTQLPDLLDTTWTGASISFDGTNIYIARGNSTTDFWKFDIASNSWQSEAPIPAPLGSGANLVYGRDGNFYLTRGANSLTFYQYNIAGNSWTSKANITTGYNFNGDQKGAYANGYIYYFRSGNTNGFLRYNISGNAWQVLNPTPQNVNYAPLAFNSDDGMIYALRGNNQYDLWKFDTSSQDWVGPNQAMNGTGTIGTGADLIWNGQTGASDYVYAVRGGSNAFYRYDVATNSWSAKANLPASVSSDVKGTYCNGNVYYLQGGNTTNFWKYSENAWTTLSSQPLPATASNGAGLACASDNSIYALRGNGTSNFYHYTSSGGWTALPNIVAGGVTYQANIGARIVSDGTNMFATMGDGETAFLKYDTGANSWSALTHTPFAQYYGTDLTYANGKIYALAGYYKDETWEYTIATDTWRQLPDNQEYTFARGPYNGASIEYAGGNSFYALTGQGLADMWSYTAGANNYLSSGTYVSQSMDLSQVANWLSFSATDDKPAGTSITYETRTSDDNSNWSSWQAISGGNVASPANRYIQVRITLNTSDGKNTPTVSDYTVSFNNEDNPPTNPNNVTGLTQQVGGQALANGQSYSNEHPYFSWSGASDPGSGVEGYYVYFGTDKSADPETGGTFQTSATYTVNAAMQDGTYYLRIKTKDNNGNVSADAWDAFTYVYSGVSPYLSETRTTQDDFNKGTLDNVSASSVDGSIRLQSISGMWNQTRLTNVPGSVYQGGELAKAAYDGHNYLFTFRGRGQKTFYRYDLDSDTWTQMADAPAPVNYGGYIIDGPDGFLYASQGGNQPTFWEYDIQHDVWITVSSAPKNFTYGSSLSYDGDRYIYALPGADDAFYQYDTKDNTWTAKPNANFNNPNAVDGQTTNIGSDSDYDGHNDIYVLQGNYYPYFAKYSIDDDESHGETGNTWTSLAPAPTGIADGGSLAYDQTTNSIFVVRGNWRKNFYKYDVASNTWTELPDVPAGFSYGASLIAYNEYIYAQRGANTTNFYRFNIAENSWEIPQSGFFGPSVPGGTSYVPYYYGAFIAGDGGSNLYIIRGGYDNTFVKYDTSTGTVTALSKLPVGTWDGSSIVYAGNENAIYYVPGSIRTRRSGANNYFFKYDIASDTWSEIATDIPPGQTGSGASMVYDGSRYIYLAQGGNSAAWWRYDTEGLAGSRWSSALPTISGWLQTTGGELLYKDGYIYSQRGGNNTFYRYDTNSSTWAKFTNNLPNTVSTGGTLMDGHDGYLYVTRGANTSEFYRYKIADGLSGTWETLSSIPAQINAGGTGWNIGNRDWVIAGNGTNSFSDGLYSYIIGSESNGTGFEKTGTYTSEPINLLSVYKWANLTADYTMPDNTFIKFETRTSDDGSNWSSWSEVTDDHASNNKHVFSINSAPGMFIQVRISFTSSDHIFSPQVDDFTINYYQDIQAPSDPASIQAFSDNTQASSIASGGWHNYAAPYFTWPAAGADGGASDGPGGSGVAGYYVYFGTDPAGNPLDFQTTNTYSPVNLVSGSTYYLRIQAADNAQNINSTIYDAFTYKFDDTAPTAPSSISVTPAGYSAKDDYTFLWNSDVHDDFSGIAKLQYRTDGDDAGVWFDMADTLTVSTVLPNAGHIVGAYQTGKNKFYLRVVDNAGNASAPISQDYYFNSSAPSPPQNLAVTPESSDDNSFAFSWDEPSSYVGESSKITYYYSVNTLPTQFNVVETSSTFAGPGPFATQKGPNTFYVVAKDEAGNIDYNLYASVQFEANTTSPGAPTNIQIFDTSDRESAAYSAAIKWVPPAGMDANNFAGYVIYRSEDGTNFTSVATTSGTAYVDSGLESKLYYYYVKAKDLTNNLSIASSTVQITPTGKYTTPPTLVGDPKFTVQSFAASFTWATNRVASSFVEYGKTISLGQTNGQIDSVTSHQVDLKGLSAGTKYFYRVKYIDQDGNIGTSTIQTFETLPPPVISDMSVSGILLDSAVASWTTNTGATCDLKYDAGDIQESGSGTNHIEKLTGLSASTSYTVQVSCLDGDGNSFSSDQYKFSTPEKPVASNVSVQNKDMVQLPTVDVAYSTNVPTTTLVYFKSSDESTPHTYLTNDKATDHKAELSGLDPAKEYTLTISGTDANGINVDPIEQKITTKTDSMPPTIVTNVAIGKVSGTGSNAQANIYIKIETDELTTIKIDYAKGVVSSSFDQSTNEDAPNTYHLITIPAEPGQDYSYRVEAYDMARNLTTSDSTSVIVQDAKASATEIITGTFASRFGWLSTLWKSN